MKYILILIIALNIISCNDEDDKLSSPAVNLTPYEKPDPNYDYNIDPNHTVRTDSNGTNNNSPNSNPSNVSDDDVDEYKVKRKLELQEIISNSLSKLKTHGCELVTENSKVSFNCEIIHKTLSDDSLTRELQYFQLKDISNQLLTYDSNFNSLLYFTDDIEVAKRLKEEEAAITPSLRLVSILKYIYLENFYKEAPAINSAQCEYSTKYICESSPEIAELNEIKKNLTADFKNQSSYSVLAMIYIFHSDSTDYWNRPGDVIDSDESLHTVRKIKSYLKALDNLIAYTEYSKTLDKDLLEQYTYILVNTFNSITYPLDLLGFVYYGTNVDRETVLNLIIAFRKVSQKDLLLLTDKYSFISNFINTDDEPVTIYKTADQVHARLVELINEAKAKK